MLQCLHVHCQLMSASCSACIFTASSCTHLVLSEMPVEAVDLVQGHEVQHLVHKGHLEEVLQCKCIHCSMCAAASAWTRTWSSVRCQWKRLSLYRAMRSSILYTKGTSKKWRPQSSSIPRQEKRGPSSTCVRGLTVALLVKAQANCKAVFQAPQLEGAMTVVDRPKTCLQVLQCDVSVSGSSQLRCWPKPGLIAKLPFKHHS